MTIQPNDERGCPDCALERRDCPDAEVNRQGRKTPRAERIDQKSDQRPECRIASPTTATADCKLQTIAAGLYKLEPQYHAGIEFAVCSLQVAVVGLRNSASVSGLDFCLSAPPLGSWRPWRFTSASGQSRAQSAAIRDSPFRHWGWMVIGIWRWSFLQRYIAMLRAVRPCLSFSISNDSATRRRYPRTLSLIHKPSSLP